VGLSGDSVMTVLQFYTSMTTLQQITGLGGLPISKSTSIDLTRLLHDDNLILMGHAIGTLFDDLSFRIIKDLNVDHASILLAACIPSKASGSQENHQACPNGYCDLKVDSSTALLWFRQKELLQMLCARAAQQFKPLVINDTTKSAICRGVFNDSAQTQAFIGVPIRLPNMASFGYICLTHQQPREWRADEVAFVSQLAASITEEIMLRMALDNRKNTHDHMRLIRLYAMLLRASGLKNAAKTTKNDAINEVLNWLVVQSTDIFNANHGFTYFAESELSSLNDIEQIMQETATPCIQEIKNESIQDLMQKMIPTRSNGLPQTAPISISHQATIGSFQVYSPRTIQVQMGKGLSGKIWRDHVPIVVDDYEKWEDRTVLVEKGRVRAMAGVPIHVRHNLCGVFGVGYADDRVFKLADVHGLGHLANMAALVLS